MAKKIHSAPQFNPDSKKWEVAVTDAATGAHLETKGGFDTRDEASDWNMQQAIKSVTQAASAELPEKKKATGSSKLSL